MHAENGRSTRTGVLVGAPSVLRLEAEGITPDRFSAIQKGSGLPEANQVTRSPLTPVGAYYAQALGWPVAVVAGVTVVRCGKELDVLTMPSRLGGEVNHLLKTHRLSAPVVELRRADTITWAFLCESRKSDRPISPLAHHGVRHMASGDYVALPASVTSGIGNPRWVDPPRLGIDENILPPWMTVFSCIRAATQR